jgi:hypothetical protein
VYRAQAKAHAGRSLRSGRLLPEGSPDDVIKGTDRDPSLFGAIA